MSTPNVTLKWAGGAGDGKRAFVVAEQNNGWEDLRIEVDTDDCDGEHAKAAMQVVIDRCNAKPVLRLTYSETDGFWLHIDAGAKKAGIHIDTPMGSIARNAMLHVAERATPEAKP